MRSSLKSINCFARSLVGGLLVTIGISLSPIQISTFSSLKSVNAQSISPKEKEAEQLLKLGDEQYEKSQFQEALQTYRKALEIYQQNKDRKGLGNSQRKLGNIFNALGQYQKAIEYLDQALEIARQVGDQESEGRTLNNFGNTFDYLGQFQKAIGYYQESIGIAKQIGDLKGEGIAQSNLGSAYYSIRQYQKAIYHYQQALAITRQINYRSAEARALNNLGIAYSSLKQYQKAIEFYQQSLVIAKQIGNIIVEGSVINNLGNTFIFLGQYQQAVGYYQQSLVIAKQIGDRSGEGRALNNLGYLFAKINQLELSILFYKQSINVREEIRKDIRGLSIEVQKSYLSTIESSYRNLVKLLLNQDRILEAQQVLDLLKVQELGNYLKTMRGNSQTAQGVELQHHELNIIALASELTNLQQKDRENKLSETEQQRLTQLVQTERDQNKQFNSFLNSPEIKELIVELRRVEEQQNLNLASYRKLQKDVLTQVPNAVLLYPLILDDRLELIIINAKTPPLRRTVSIKREQLNQDIIDFLSELRDASSEDVKEPAKKLYKLLIQPFEAELKELKIDTIIYAPDGQLRYIPLSALYDGKQWLVEKYRVNNITAESLTSFAPKPLAKQPRVFAGAFGGKEGDKKRAGFDGLPATITEVQKIASLFPNTTTLTESAFSKQITVTKANSHTILHLATHGQLSVGTPEDSFILFGNGEKATIREIQDWSLSNVDLVILSACQSGLGSKLGTGVEILGLGYQMQAAGARVAIASLWKVDDAGTQALMTAFYGELQKDDATVTEALRRAQVSLIRSSKYNHPNYWSAFFAIGNGL
jgi:CHAT domain-containing protein/tetratricopeptide (TPR) repeat protein